MLCAVQICAFLHRQSPHLLTSSKRLNGSFLPRILDNLEEVGLCLTAGGSPKGNTCGLTRLPLLHRPRRGRTTHVQPHSSDCLISDSPFYTAFVSRFLFMHITHELYQSDIPPRFPPSQQCAGHQPGACRRPVPLHLGIRQGERGTPVPYCWHGRPPRRTR